MRKRICLPCILTGSQEGSVKYQDYKIWDCYDIMHSVRANIIIKLYFLIKHFLCKKKLNKFLSDVVYLLLSYIISAKILIFGYRKSVTTCSRLPVTRCSSLYNPEEGLHQLHCPCEQGQLCPICCRNWRFWLQDNNEFILTDTLLHK